VKRSWNFHLIEFAWVFLIGDYLNLISNDFNTLRIKRSKFGPNIHDTVVFRALLENYYRNIYLGTSD